MFLCLSDICAYLYLYYFIPFNIPSKLKNQTNQIQTLYQILIAKIYKIQMEKYQKLKKLGAGSFGNVELAQNKITKQIVAIKQLKKKYGTWDQCLQLSEVKALRKMNHPNVIGLKQMVRMGNDVSLVFQYIQKDLFKLITERRQKGKFLEEYQIRHITRQMAESLAYIHKQGFFHRDLKPENVLIDQQFNIKLIDFGIAKQIRSKPPFTQYCSTRWYRAPEILLRFSAYSAPVDIFAIGCIIAEMYLMKPLFQGNSQMDQISKITSILGTPKNWNQGLKQAVKKGINLPQYSTIQLQTFIPNCSAEGIDFINQCLRWEPSKRITASQMLQHPFIKNIKYQAKLEQIKKQETGNKYSKPVLNQSSSNSKSNGIQANINAKSNNLNAKSNNLNAKSNSKQYAYKQFDQDQIFDQLLNNFQNCDINAKSSKALAGSGNNISSKEDDDEWN